LKYFAAILRVRDTAKNITVRPRHLAFLDKAEAQGKLFARGPFTDGSGGLVIYKSESMKEVRKLATQDPYVNEGARELELHEWQMKPVE
jgi:uncharacterized protein